MSQEWCQQDQEGQTLLMSVVDVVSISSSFFSSHKVGPHLHRDSKRLRGGCKSRSVASVVVSDDTNNPKLFLGFLVFLYLFNPSTKRNRERERESIDSRAFSVQFNFVVWLPGWSVTYQVDVVHGIKCSRVTGNLGYAGDLWPLSFLFSFLFNDWRISIVLFSTIFDCHVHWHNKNK